MLDLRRTQLVNKLVNQITENPQLVISSALQISWRFKLPQAVPLNDCISYENLAAKVGLDQGVIERVMRTLMTRGMFHQPDPDHVSHSRLSATLATEQWPDALFSMVFGWATPAIMHVADALTKWGSSQKPNETGFNVAKNTDKTMWELLEQDLEAQKMFGKFMNFTSDVFGVIDGLISGYDWAGLGDAVVVDVSRVELNCTLRGVSTLTSAQVAGSIGHISRKLAGHFPQLEFIVQDYEAVCRQGEAILPAELRGRIRFQPHNMFDAQQGIPDRKIVYFLRMILHDWSDQECCRILRAVLPGLKRGDRIIVQEHIVPDPGTGSLFVEQVLRCV